MHEQSHETLLACRPYRRPSLFVCLSFWYCFNIFFGTRKRSCETGSHKAQKHQMAKENRVLSWTCFALFLLAECGSNLFAFCVNPPDRKRVHFSSDARMMCNWGKRSQRMRGRLRDDLERENCVGESTWPMGIFVRGFESCLQSEPVVVGRRFREKCAQ